MVQYKVIALYLIVEMNMKLKIELIIKLLEQSIRLEIISSVSP